MPFSIRRGPWLAISLLILGSVLAPAVSEACATCFGDPESPMTKGMNNAILLLLGVVGLVQVGFVTLFWSIRKRNKRVTESRNVDGGVR